ncbi:unnamed protein product [Amoebophrya sp. A25]|nr:unnamed protein product [Amoebophrya sp. A25]|eukprot:GSA25T00018158001.1
MMSLFSGSGMKMSSLFGGQEEEGGDDNGEGDDKDNDGEDEVEDDGGSGDEDSKDSSSMMSLGEGTFCPDTLIENLHPRNADDIPKKFLAEEEQEGIVEEEGQEGAEVLEGDNVETSMASLASVLMSKSEIKKAATGLLDKDDCSGDASVRTAASSTKSTTSGSGGSPEGSKSSPENTKKTRPSAGSAENSDHDEEEQEEEDSDDEAEIANRIRREVTDILEAKFPDKSDRMLLRARTRYNALGFYTSNEQFCYPLTYQKFQGTGLYFLASGFNHSCEPNVSRYSCGDVMILVTNKAVKKGQQLCISYVENEILSEAKKIRDGTLDRDFICACDRCEREKSAHETSSTRSKAQDAEKKQETWAAVDAQLQAELALMPPMESLALIDEYLDSDHKLLAKDKQELRSTKGMTLCRLGRFREAIETFSGCAKWQAENTGEFDESLVTYHLLRLVCVLAMQCKGQTSTTPKASTESEPDKKKQKKSTTSSSSTNETSESATTTTSIKNEALESAVKVHGVLTGVQGIAFLRQRYKRELEEYLRWTNAALNKNQRQELQEVLKTTMAEAVETKL